MQTVNTEVPSAQNKSRGSFSTCTWHDNLVAGYTLGGEFITVAVVAEQSVVLAGEGLICQRAIAAETAEAMLVVMPVVVEELLAAAQEDRTRPREVISYRCKSSTRSRLLGCVSSKNISERERERREWQEGSM